MALFTNQLFTTGSFIFNKEGASHLQTDAFISMSIDAAGNVTASFAGADQGTYMGDVRLDFGSSWDGSNSRYAQFFIRRKSWISEPGMDAGYELRIGPSEHGYTPSTSPFSPADHGISIRNPYSSTTATIPFWIGGGLNNDPFNTTQNSQRNKHATLAISASKHHSTQMRTTVRLINEGETTSAAQGHHVYGSHINIKRGDAYHHMYGDNVWMGNYDYEQYGSIPAKVLPRGAFYMAFGGNDSYGIQPPKLEDQSSSSGFQFLLVTQSAGGGSGGNNIAKTLIGGAYSANPATTANAFIRPSGSLHVLASSGQNNGAVTYTGGLLDNEDFNFIVEGLSSGADAPTGGGHSIIGIKSGREFRGHFAGTAEASHSYVTHGATVTAAIGVVNWSSGQSADQTDEGDFFIGLIDGQRGNKSVSYQYGAQDRLYMNSSGSLSIYSGSTWTNTEALQFPPASEYIAAPNQFKIPTGSINSFSSDGTYPTVNLVHYKDNGSSGDPEKGDILGHVGFRSFLRETHRDGLGALIEARATHNWDPDDNGGIGDRPTELNFYTRKMGGYLPALTIDETKSTTIWNNLMVDNNINVSGSITMGASLIHEGDTNTKLTFGTDNIDLTTGGVVGLTVDSSQLVTLSADLKVAGNDIKDSGGNTVISFDGSGNIDSNPLSIKGTGLQKLRLWHSSTTSAEGPELRLLRNASNGITSGSNIGEIRFLGSENDSDFGHMAAIIAEGDGNFVHNSNHNGRIGFWTADGTAFLEKMRITAVGEVLALKQPSFAARRSSHGSQVTKDSYSTIIFNGELHDETGDYDTGSGVFYVPVSGKYYFTSQVVMDQNSADAAYYYLLINHSGGESRGSMVDVADIFDSAPSYYQMSVGGVFDCSAGDTVRVQFYQSGGSNSVRFLGSTSTPSSARSTFSGYLLG